MRGDQLSRQWHVLRQIEAIKYGLTAAECPLRDPAQARSLRLVLRRHDLHHRQMLPAKRNPTFVLDRIRVLRLTDETFKVPVSFDLNHYLRYSFKVMQDELYTVKIRISPVWSPYIGEKMQIRKLSDDALEMIFRVPEPEGMQELIRAELHGGLLQYDAPSKAFQKSMKAQEKAEVAGTIKIT